jgi:hypothetical protein
MIVQDEGFCKAQPVRYGQNVRVVMQTFRALLALVFIEFEFCQIEMR